MLEMILDQLSLQHFQEFRIESVVVKSRLRQQMLFCYSAILIKIIGVSLTDVTRDIYIYDCQIKGTE